MKGKHFRKREKMSVKTKSIILSVVALIEIILLSVSMTFSWFESVTSLEIKGNNIHTAEGINSAIVLGENANDDDDTYSEMIDLTSFYEAQNEVRLSPVSSADGVNFFAPYSTNSSGETLYRKLSQEDINANIIQFEFTISSPHGATDIYLSELVPRLLIEDKNGNVAEYGYDAKDENQQKVYPYRFAYSDGDTSYVLTPSYVTASTSGNTYKEQIAVVSLNADDTAVTKSDYLESIYSYRYRADHSTINNVLFHLNKGETKTFTASVWLDALDSYWRYDDYKPIAGDKIAISAKLVTSWSAYQTVTVYDYTASQWITNSSSGDGRVLCIKNLDGNSDAREYHMTYDATNHTWSCNLPIALNNIEIYWKSTSSSGTIYNRWEVHDRGTITKISIFGSDDVIPGIGGEDEVTRIALSDYTDSSWLNNNGNDNKSPKMRISINYNGTDYNYSMTDNPTADSNGKDTWYTYIPDSIQNVHFYRCESSNNATIYNYWYGKDRGNETVFRVLDSANTVYLRVPEEYASMFFINTTSRSAYVSVTSDHNKNVISGLSDRSKLQQSAYITLESNANSDDWYYNSEGNTSTYGEMKKLDDNTFSFTFDANVISNGTYLTFWDRCEYNYNDINNETSFAPALKFNLTSGNMFTLTSPVRLTEGNFANKDAYIFNGTLSTYTDEGNLVQSGGVWGELKLDTYFKHYNSSVSSLKANYTLNNKSYEVSLTKSSDGLTWHTDDIPVDITNVTFTDGTLTWDTSGRSEEKNYFYATGKSMGEWDVAGMLRVYLAVNNTWSGTFYAHYYNSNESTTWPGRAMTYVGTRNSTQKVYATLIKADTTNIIFNNNYYQTGKFTSFADMRGYYTSGTSTWTATSSFLG